MEKVLYRELTKEDYPRIKNLICEAFGFNDFIKCPKALNHILNVYLQSCIFESSFSNVAVKDGVVIGIFTRQEKRSTRKHKENAGNNK